MLQESVPVTLPTVPQLLLLFFLETPESSQSGILGSLHQAAPPHTFSGTRPPGGEPSAVGALPLLSL